MRRASTGVNLAASSATLFSIAKGIRDTTIKSAAKSNAEILAETRAKMQAEIKAISKNPEHNELSKAGENLEQAVKRAQAVCSPGGFGQS